MCAPNVLFASDRQQLTGVTFILQRRLKVLKGIFSNLDTDDPRGKRWRHFVKMRKLISFLSFRNTSETHIRLIINVLNAVYPLVRDTRTSNCQNRIKLFVRSIKCHWYISPRIENIGFSGYEILLKLLLLFLFYFFTGWVDFFGHEKFRNSV